MGTSSGSTSSSGISRYFANARLVYFFLRRMKIHSSGHKSLPILTLASRPISGCKVYLYPALPAKFLPRVTLVEIFYCISAHRISPILILVRSRSLQGVAIWQQFCFINRPDPGEHLGNNQAFWTCIFNRPAAPTWVWNALEGEGAAFPASKLKLRQSELRTSLKME